MTGRLFSSRGRRRDRDERERGFLEGERDPKNRRAYLEFWIGEGMGRRPTRRAKSRNGAAGDLPADRRERSRYSHAIVSQRARKKSRGSEEGERKEATEEEEKRLLSRCFLLSALFLRSFLSSPARSSGTKLA